MSQFFDEESEEHDEPVLDSRSDRADQRLVATILSFVAIFLIYDIVEDLTDGATLAHMAWEGAMFVATIVGAWRMLAKMRRLRQMVTRTGMHAAKIELEASQWREEARRHVEGLVQSIDRQLDRWALSPSEKEICFLILKGFSHKHIADLRTVSEATIRKQAFAIYRKAGLAGRSELSAFFLEELLAPKIARAV